MKHLVDDAELVDFIIIGAGASGLSLFLQLSKNHHSHKIKLLERSTEAMHDRIWSFWQANNTSGDKHTVKHEQALSLIQPIISHQWSRWSISSSDTLYTMRDKHYRYCSVPASALSKMAEQCASQTASSTIQYNCDVLSVVAYGEYVLVNTATEQFLSKKVIDTRPPALNVDHQGLLQCFYGEEILLDAELFDDACVRLMDQLNHSELGIEFVYILPFSAQHALIEFTCFSKNVIAEEVLKSKLHQAVKRLVKHHTYQVIRTEKATLPMYLINQNTHQDNDNIIYGGIAGGAMRAASGYSFINSQRWAKRCAAQLLHGQRVSKLAPIHRLYQCMDLVMLKVLRDDLGMGVIVFEQMFKKVRPASFARFMTEQATFHDFLCVIWAMPKRPFIKTALLLIYSRTKLVFRKKANSLE